MLKALSCGCESMYSLLFFAQESLNSTIQVGTSAASSDLSHPKPTGQLFDWWTVEKLLNLFN